MIRKSEKVDVLSRSTGFLCHGKSKSSTILWFELFEPLRDLRKCQNSDKNLFCKGFSLLKYWLRVIFDKRDPFPKYVHTEWESLRKWIFFGAKDFFSWILISKIDVKMNLRIRTESHAVDSKIGSSLKIDFKTDWTNESNPTAWELIFNLNS